MLWFCDFVNCLIEVPPSSAEKQEGRARKYFVKNAVLLFFCFFLDRRFTI
jgi:hypothetical protein